MKKPIIWLALWSWSARWLAHIWIIKALEEKWIKPDIICWTSIWSMIWASYINWNLDKIEKWFSKLTKYQILKFLNINLMEWNLIDRNKIKVFFNNYIWYETQKIEELWKKYWTIATAYKWWEEVEFLEWNLYDAIFSSISMPGLFTPYDYKWKYMLDWWIVNPVPVSLCKKLWADIVIAVDLNASLMSDENDNSNNKEDILNLIWDNDFLKKIYNKTEKYLKNKEKEDFQHNILKTFFKTINIMQFKITNNRLEKDKPDVVLRPMLFGVWVLDFDKLDKCKKEWVRCVKEKEKELENIIKLKNGGFFKKLKSFLNKNFKFL